MKWPQTSWQSIWAFGAPVFELFCCFLSLERRRDYVYKWRCTPTKQLMTSIINKPFLLTLQVPCWLRPRDRTRSPEVLNNVSRPTTLPLRIPPRISITQADTDRFTHNFISDYWFHLAGSSAWCLISVLPNHQTFPPLLVLQLRSRKWRVTRSHPAGFAESRPHPAHLLSPGPEKRVLPLPLWLGLRHVAQDGLAELLPRQRRVRLMKKDKDNEWDGERACMCVPICYMRNIIIISLSVPTSLRHTGEDFIVTPFAQVSLT